MTEELMIIRRVVGGDVDSFRSLVERYQRPVLRMIRHIINDRHACEDVGQEVFLTAYKKLASFDPARSSFSTWLFTIARNMSLNALKKKRMATPGDLPDQADPRRPWEDLAEREFFDEMDRRLQALPPGQRMAFILAEFEDLPYDQIAQIEGVSTGTVKSRISRAKRTLRSALADLCGDRA